MKTRVSQMEGAYEKTRNPLRELSSMQYEFTVSRCVYAIEHLLYHFLRNERKMT